MAHALTVEATQMCLDAGVDGLANLFMDRPHTPGIIDAIARSGAFVVACVTLNASMMGITGKALADDPRVAQRLPAEWDTTLRSSFNRYPQGRLEDVLASVTPPWVIPCHVRLLRKRLVEPVISRVHGVLGGRRHGEGQ